MDGGIVGLSLPSVSSCSLGPVYSIIQAGLNPSSLLFSLHPFYSHTNTNRTCLSSPNLSLMLYNPCSIWSWSSFLYNWKGNEVTNSKAHKKQLERKGTRGRRRRAKRSSDGEWNDTKWNKDKQQKRKEAKRVLVGWVVIWDGLYWQSFTTNTLRHLVESSCHTYCTYASKHTGRRPQLCSVLSNPIMNYLMFKCSMCASWIAMLLKSWLKMYWPQIVDKQEANDMLNYVRAETWCWNDNYSWKSFLLLGPLSCI